MCTKLSTLNRKLKRFDLLPTRRPRKFLHKYALDEMPQASMIRRKFLGQSL